MLSGWGYRVAAVAGAGAITVMAVLLANAFVVQDLFTTYTPLFWRLEPMLLAGEELWLAIMLNTVVVLAVLWPLYKPRPRRVLDTVFVAQRRVIVAVFALATLGYFNYSYRLPRSTLAITGGLLFLVLPVWFVWIRQRNHATPERAVLIGDDPRQLRELVRTVNLPFVGYLCPAGVERELNPPDRQPMIADGGLGVTRLGGLSRIEDVLVDYDIDTAVLAFGETDRGEFFGTLDACYDHGINVKVHRQFADTVLTREESGEDLVDVAIEPWDPQDYLIKRAFDIAFSSIGLLVLAPVIALIAIAIKVDDGHRILYSQERTAGFGESFVVHKFRTMTPARASPDPEADAERVTRVGAILRTTHLDEIPQLWTILVGRMSAVGPRAVWVKEENLIEASVDPDKWRQRWFVKPGLTGLAQINGAGSDQPDEKLRYDLSYIRRQSFWLDVKIILRQIWLVLRDVGYHVLGRTDEQDEPRRGRAD